MTDYILFMPATNPVHDLAVIQRQVATSPAIVVVNVPNTTEIVMGTLGLGGREARAFVFSLIGRLTLAHYAGPFEAMTPPADVYGLFSDGWGWYIKVSLRHGRLHVHSCHPPVAPLVTSTETVTARP